MAPRTILGDTWWNQQRKQAAAQKLYRCWACGIPKTKAKRHKWLEGHESYDINWEVGTCRLTGVVALCHYCHNYIHRGRMEVLLAYNKLDQQFVDDVIRHGDNLTAHLPRPEPVTQMAAWEDWVLIVDGTPYPSRFRSEVEWASYYNWINSTGQSDTNDNLKQFKPVFAAAVADAGNYASGGGILS